ncbi:MAG: RNA-directed DNA polymerase [Bacteroidetes bacterium]|nr:MAG: RNA-directed DNA polymerase [Bacteroidota bacterium]
MDHFRLAIDNISKFGDTDIFPFPIENALFYDKPNEVKSILQELDNDFDQWLVNYPVDAIKTCVPVGYTGFRWASIIDPIWNAYLLSQVIKISDDLEKSRIDVAKDCIFSYRIQLDEESGKLFNSDVSWRLFYSTAQEIADSHKYVVRFDISDFYNRVYHHRLENALHRTNADRPTVNKIMKILQDLSNNVSYGLPIGGNASRILAEILLNSMDQMMSSKKIKFCRFVDDYIVFADSKEDAFRKLNWCAEFLLRNEGLALQKNKTQVQTSAEFISHAKATLEGEDDKEDKERASFMKIHLRYDPYSATAEEDYNELKKKLEDFDIVSLIRAEIKKSRIHQAFGKHLLNAVNILEGEPLALAFKTIATNLESLYPIFPSVMQLANRKLLDCDSETIGLFIETLCELVENDSYMIQTENNASYVARILSKHNSENSIQAIDQLATKHSSALVKANCLYSMTNLDNYFWLSDIRSKFSMLSKWERRAFIASSYYLSDEGKHWRDHTKTQFTKLELLVRDWVANKNPTQNSWKLPL